MLEALGWGPGFPRVSLPIAIRALKRLWALTISFLSDDDTPEPVTIPHLGLGDEEKQFLVPGVFL